jgi:hypothetical protein
MVEVKIVRANRHSLVARADAIADFPKKKPAPRSLPLAP